MTTQPLVNSTGLERAWRARSTAAAMHALWIAATPSSNVATIPCALVAGVPVRRPNRVRRAPA